VSLLLLNNGGRPKLANSDSELPAILEVYCGRKKMEKTIVMLSIASF
jgi:hypothetical protein